MRHDTREGAPAQAAFYPYGTRRDDAAAAEPTGRCHAGAAQVEDGQGRVGLETYFLERAGPDWVLSSRLFDAPALLLARVSATRLPADPLDAAAELLADLWTLRQPGRLRLLRPLREAGALGPARWRRIATRLPQRPPLENALRAEGHAVRTAPGPIGTTEHILLLRTTPAR